MKEFKTESKKLLDLMINSIYTNREIFLRELISNASDAVDKLYFQSLTNPDMNFAPDELRIQVSWDEEARTVTVSDNGIGMDEEGLDNNLGTIAHSDSMEFKNDEEKQSEDIDIIGQFGVGFYSAFMVGDLVTVITKPYGSDQAWKWTSTGVDGYTVEPTEKEGWGTDVIVHLRPDTDEEKYGEFLNEHSLKSLIRRYSNYVRYPIMMECEHSRELPKPEDAGDDYKPEYEQYTELETVNSRIPIWKRKKSEVPDEEYNEFYTTTFHDYADPLKTISFHAEGAISYDVLLFIPSRAPFDLYSKEYKKGLQLYSSNVLIMDKCEDLLFDHFNFVKGVVDSQDLTLNISRETLQQNNQLRAIAKRIDKKITQALESMRDNERDKYEEFFAAFGRTLKYGIYSSYGMKKDQLGGLMLFHSAKEGKLVTLDEYLANCPEDQENIYYATGESIERLSTLPMVKSVLNRGYDVLLCCEDVDEFCMISIDIYNEKQLRNVADADLGLETEEEKQEAEEATKSNEALFAAMQEALGDKVTKVAVSPRLVDVPAALSAEGPVSLEMEKMMAMMPDADGSVKASRVLEINAKHPVFATLQVAQEVGDAEKVKLYTGILYDQALLMEGMPIEDPVAFAEAVAKLMK